MMCAHTHNGKRTGSVLVAVMWATALAAATGFAIASAWRSEERRVALSLSFLQSEWQAEGCKALILSVAGDLLDQSQAESLREARWNSLGDSLTARLPHPSEECVWQLEPAGQFADVTALPVEYVQSGLARAGIAPIVAESLIAALHDWSDENNDTRSNGAESEWYRRLDRPGASNRPPQTGEELAAVRGWSRPEIRSLLSAGDGPVSLQHAQESVLAMLPGSSQELAQKIVAERSVRGAVTDLTRLISECSLECRERNASAYQLFQSSITLQPQAWLLRIATPIAHGAVTYEMRMRLTRAGVQSGTISIERLWH